MDKKTLLQVTTAYLNFLKRSHKQMRNFSCLTESQTCDRTASFMQGEGFTVSVSGDVTFGQNYTAVCKT